MMIVVADASVLVAELLAAVVEPCSPESARG